MTPYRNRAEAFCGAPSPAPRLSLADMLVLDTIYDGPFGELKHESHGVRIWFLPRTRNVTIEVRMRSVGWVVREEYEAT